MTIIALIVCSFMSIHKPKLIYIGDPMCSWCYGISDELNEVKAHYSTLPFEMVMGGLRPYNTQTMVELKSFLTHHWEDVANASGQAFNYSILDDATITYDTEPPCRAAVTVRELDPSKEFDFFKAIQSGFYKDNKNMHLAESYQSILLKLNLDYEAFKTLFESKEMREKVKLDFQRSAELNVSSFPTLLLEDHGKYHIIAQGFATKEKMISRIESHLN